MLPLARRAAMFLPRLFGNAWMFVVLGIVLLEASFHGAKMKEHPTIGRILWVAPWVYVPLVVLVFLLAYRLDKWSAKRLAEAGVGASAVVVEVRDTGVELGVSPVFIARVRVSPSNGEPFESEVQFTPSRPEIGAIRPGTPLTVRYDPSDRSRIAAMAGP